MVRPARADEKPGFGSVWAWAEPTSPLMSIGPSRAWTEGGTVRWTFLRLDDGTVDGSWFWSEPDGTTIADWLLIDDE